MTLPDPLMTTAAPDRVPSRIADAIRERHRFVIVSHARPDGDAIGSSMAMAFALQRLGKQVRVVSRDAAPPAMLAFPGVDTIEVTSHVDDPGDAVIVMECGDLARTGVSGLDGGFVINIDHHIGNTMYGALNWFDTTAAACGEMVYELIAHHLRIPLTREMATHVYVAILTDTGSFHYSNITPRTFEICRVCVEAGVSPPAIAAGIFNSNNLGRLKLFGAVLSRMELDPTGRIATVCVDERLAESCGGTYEDTEGLINLPLTVKDIVAAVFFKEHGPDYWRVSLRSKGDIDVNAVAAAYGGGGHKNASGCSAHAPLAELKAAFSRLITEQIDAAALQTASGATS